ncbi:hypothetical protein CHARACLAT_014301 [Characodon lateralis]|uniref:Uncharacterized protein n=1 Tax=Characodon lateralis TaxID=208331 RepID=A0ABU7DRH0_9TELE|nr:hypothetical protein [Characodon lateralis]
MVDYWSNCSDVLSLKSPFPQVILLPHDPQSCRGPQQLPAGTRGICESLNSNSLSSFFVSIWCPVVGQCCCFVFTCFSLIVAQVAACLCLYFCSYCLCCFAIISAPPL